MDPARTSSRRRKRFGIADSLAKQGYSIERKKIQLDEPIKQIGEHKVPLRLHREVIAEITVQVEKEE